MKTLIETTETTISVRGEYNSEFVTGARRLAGKWKAPYWVFDIRNEDAVRELCMTCYGTDGRTTDLVDVRITIPEDGRVVGGGKGPIELFGRTLARAFGRDSGAKLGDGVVVEKGGFSSGGSMKNWSTTVKDGTVVVLRDVSRRLVERHDDDAFIVEIIGGQNTVDREALISEREKLVARLAEIDEILAN